MRLSKMENKKQIVELTIREGYVFYPVVNGRAQLGLGVVAGKKVRLDINGTEFKGQRIKFVEFIDGSLTDKKAEQKEPEDDEQLGNSQKLEKSGDKEAEQKEPEQKKEAKVKHTANTSEEDASDIDALINEATDIDVDKIKAPETNAFPETLQDVDDVDALEDDYIKGWAVSLGYTGKSNSRKVLLSFIDENAF
jgi:outer membrane protein assembly factor BamA